MEKLYTNLPSFWFSRISKYFNCSMKVSLGNSNMLELRVWWSSFLSWSMHYANKSLNTYNECGWIQIERYLLWLSHWTEMSVNDIFHNLSFHIKTVFLIYSNKSIYYIPLAVKFCSICFVIFTLSALSKDFCRSSLKCFVASNECLLLLACISLIWPLISAWNSLKMAKLE